MSRDADTGVHRIGEVIDVQRASSLCRVLKIAARLAHRPAHAEDLGRVV